MSPDSPQMLLFILFGVIPVGIVLVLLQEARQEYDRRLAKCRWNPSEAKVAAELARREAEMAGEAVG